MVKIRITKTIPVAVDGIHIRHFSKDWEGEVDAPLVDLLIKLNAAVIVRERTMPEPSERAVIESVPEIAEEKDTQVFQLAKDLGTSNRAILNKAKDLGISAGASVSKLTGEEVIRIKRALGIK